MPSRRACTALDRQARCGAPTRQLTLENSHEPLDLVARNGGSRPRLRTGAVCRADGPPGTGAAPAPSAASSSPTSPGHDMSSMPGHDMSAMPGHDMATMKGHSHDAPMKSALGPYPMTREGSGTSWQPDATPMEGLHFTARRVVGDGARLRQPRPRPAERTAWRPQDLHRKHGDADGPAAARRRHARRAGDGVAGPDERAARLSAAVPDRRDRRRHHAARRSPASARLLHGAGDVVQRAAGERRLGVRLHRPAGRAGPRAARVHAPLLRHAQPGSAADAPLARLHAHHLRRRDARRQQGTVPARSVVVQRPRARPAALEHRDAPVRLVVGALLVQPDRRALDAGQPRRSEEPRAARGGHPRAPHAPPRSATTARRPRRNGRRPWPTAAIASPAAMPNTTEPGWLLESTVVLRNRAHVLRPRRAGPQQRAVRATASRCTVRRFGSASSRWATSSTWRRPVRSPGGSAGWSACTTRRHASIRSTAAHPRSYMLFLQGRL